MGRPVYPYELGDPDFSWLISNFQEQHPNYSSSETTALPLVFIKTCEYEDIFVQDDSPCAEDGVPNPAPEVDSTNLVKER